MWLDQIITVSMIYLLAGLNKLRISHESIGMNPYIYYMHNPMLDYH